MKIAIYGPMCSGKTTVANLLMGLIKNSSGQISFLNKEINHYIKHQRINFRKNIQMIFQDPYGSLNPRKTIGSTLSLALKIHFKLKDEALRKKVFELLNMVELNQVD